MLTEQGRKITSPPQHAAMTNGRHCKAQRSALRRPMHRTTFFSHRCLSPRAALFTLHLSPFTSRRDSFSLFTFHSSLPAGTTFHSSLFTLHFPKEPLFTLHFPLFTSRRDHFSLCTFHSSLPAGTAFHSSLFTFNFPQGCSSLPAGTKQGRHICGAAPAGYL